MVFRGTISRSRCRTLVLLLLVSGAAALLVSSTSASTEVSITADGDQSYFLGEKVVFRGQNTGSGTTYLFLTGPNLPAAGGKLTSPDKAVVSGNPDSFTVVNTKPDNTWEYTFYTANLQLDAGTYGVYAVSRPDAMDQAGPGAASIGIILKKPFITANISSSEGIQGHPFSVTGRAEGIPPKVQVWIFGDHYVFTTKIPVNPDASFTFRGEETESGRLPRGNNYLFVQHPMQDNLFDIVTSGDYVRNMKLNNGTTLFRITGPGSLQGSDAADALVAAFGESATRDDTNSRDTYTMILFQVDDAGQSAMSAQPTTTTPFRTPAQHASLQYTSAGAIVLILVIAGWKRR